MPPDRPPRYHRELNRVCQIMLDELAFWDWRDLTPLESIVTGQIRRKGKQLRPRLALAVADHLGGSPERACAPAAGVEFYHLASLVLDDVQDNAEVRRGAPTVHTTATVSMAINAASLIRSLSYHAVHRCQKLSRDEKLTIHREIDDAATRLVLGQSIDIGWHLDWYPAAAAFPYQRMIEWKTGSMFGCAASVGAIAAGAGPAAVDAARDWGIALGSLYQSLNDYLDFFAPDGGLLRPGHEDFRQGKMSGPVVFLLDQIRSRSGQRQADLVSERLASQPQPRDWEWLVGLLEEHRVQESLRHSCLARAEALSRELTGISPAGHPAGLLGLLDAIVAPLHVSPAEPGYATRPEQAARRDQAKLIGSQ